MGAAFLPAINAALAWLGSAELAAVLVRTILINVALGSLEFEHDGEVWVAVE